MKTLLIIFLSAFIYSTTNPVLAQSIDSINLTDIELKNLGDGQMFGHNKDIENTPLEGPVRIITGITTEYIDAEFENGYATGKWEYYKNNNLISYAMYNNGYMDGEFAEFLGNGDIKMKGFYTLGKKEGEWSTYGSDETIKLLEIYSNNKLVRKVTYYTNGNIDTECSYINGRLNGILKKYTLDGDLKTEENYIKGKQVGKQIRYITSNIGNYIEKSNYSESGKKEGDYEEVYVDKSVIKTKGQYLNGQKHGKWIYKNQSGKQIKEEKYDNGKLLQ